MHSFLNKSRPPVFCPGCAHERVIKALDKAFLNMGLNSSKIVIVSDIGCSGLFDTYFNTHALHGLHGRALTYATGLKMARPEMTVIVTMGDGGLGIGGAHVLGTCRRNIDLTLLVLNNFNYGMTGGQSSSTTPANAQVGSGFLNRLEKPMDAGRMMRSAGAGYVTRISSYNRDLPVEMEKAIYFKGFSVLDLWGVCPGRYTRRNKLTPSMIDEDLAALPSLQGPVPENDRKEYGSHYRELAAALEPVSPPKQISAEFKAPQTGRQEVIILGSAGQRILTAGEILCLAGLSAGLRASQKNDYPITVLRGHSVSELVLSDQDIEFSGISKPCVILALAAEGVARRRSMFKDLNEKTLVILDSGVELPETGAKVIKIDFKAQKIKSHDRALASLAILARMNRVITIEMLEHAVGNRFGTKVLESAMALIRRVKIMPEKGLYGTIYAGK